MVLVISPHHPQYATVVARFPDLHAVEHAPKFMALRSVGNRRAFCLFYCVMCICISSMITLKRIEKAAARTNRYPCIPTKFWVVCRV